MASIIQKQKMLHLTQIFRECTDDQHGLGWEEVIAKLEERGIKIERKTLADDIEALTKYGDESGLFKIDKLSKRPVVYAMTEREFSEDDIVLLIDAVQASRFLTEEGCDHLTNLIKKQASARQQADLKGKVHVTNRVASASDSDLPALNCIQTCIAQRKRVGFQYYYVNFDLEAVPKHSGATYDVAPAQIMYDRGRYYLIGWDVWGECEKTFRLDRMRDVSASDKDSADACDIEALVAKDYLGSPFRGEPVEAVFLAIESVMDQIVDEFGREKEKVRVEPIREDGEIVPGKAYVRVDVCESKQLYAWLAHFNPDELLLVGPESLRKGYAEHITRIAADYLFKSTENRE